MNTAALALCAALGLASAGCAFGEGSAFGELEATLQARYQLVPERDRGDGWQKLDTDFEVRITRLELEVITIDLEDVVDASVTADSDPAGASTLAALPVGTLDLVAGVDRRLDCVDSCQMSRGHIGRARLSARHLDGRGEVRDGRAAPRFDGVLSWQMATPLGINDEDRSGLLDAPLDVPIDRTEPPAVRIELHLGPTAKLLDGVAFDEVAVELGTVEPLDLAAHDESAERVVDNFAATQLTALASRSDQ